MSLPRIAHKPRKKQITSFRLILAFISVEPRWSVRLFLHLKTKPYLFRSDSRDGQAWNFVLSKKVDRAGFHCCRRLATLKPASDKQLVNVIGEGRLVRVSGSVEYRKQALG